MYKAYCFSRVYAKKICRYTPELKTNRGIRKAFYPNTLFHIIFPIKFYLAGYRNPENIHIPRKTAQDPPETKQGHARDQQKPQAINQNS